MDQALLHTFIIVAYKESEFLEICLQSLLEQRVASRILITTSTPSAFLAKIAGRFNLTVRVNPQPNGIAADWNFAYSQAETPYVTLAHQDDFYEPDYTEKILEAIRKQPHALIAFTNYRELHGTKKKNLSTLLVVKRLLLAPFWVSPISNSSFLKRLILTTGNPICCPSVWFHKARLGNFRFSDQYRVNLDWEAWRRIADYPGSFVFMRTALVCHRKHEQSESTLTIVSDVRKREDTQLLRQSWGKWLGSWISEVYALGYQSYKPLLRTGKV